MEPAATPNAPTTIAAASSHPTRALPRAKRRIRQPRPPSATIATAKPTTIHSWVSSPFADVGRRQHGHAQERRDRAEVHEDVAVVGVPLDGDDPQRHVPATVEQPAGLHVVEVVAERHPLVEVEAAGGDERGEEDGREQRTDRERAGVHASVTPGGPPVGDVGGAAFDLLVLLVRLVGASASRGRVDFERGSWDRGHQTLGSKTSARNGRSTNSRTVMTTTVSTSTAMSPRSR